MIPQFEDDEMKATEEAVEMAEEEINQLQEEKCQLENILKALVEDVQKTSHDVDNRKNELEIMNKTLTQLMVDSDNIAIQLETELNGKQVLLKQLKEKRQVHKASISESE